MKLEAKVTIIAGAGQGIGSYIPCFRWCKACCRPELARRQGSLVCMDHMVYKLSIIIYRLLGS